MVTLFVKVELPPVTVNPFCRSAFAVVVNPTPEISPVAVMSAPLIFENVTLSVVPSCKLFLASLLQHFQHFVEHVEGSDENEYRCLFQHYQEGGCCSSWRTLDFGEKNFQVEISHLPPEFKSNKDIEHKHNYDLNLPIKDARKIFEKKYLETQLKRFKGNIAKTSTFVGMDRSALHRKIKELDIRIGK